MRKSRRLYVNQVDIDGGGARCPIERSMDRQKILGRKKFNVGCTEISISGGRGKLKLSKKALQFIDDYDWGLDVTPTHVTIIDESGKYL